MLGHDAGFANEAQFLLVNAESVREVARRVAAKAGTESPITDAQLQVQRQTPLAKARLLSTCSGLACSGEQVYVLSQVALCQNVASIDRFLLVQSNAPAMPFRSIVNIATMVSKVDWVGLPTD